MLADSRAALDRANSSIGLALSDDEIITFTTISRIRRNPTDVELMMFAQANSEHCRHKIFNATWVIDGNSMPYSLRDDQAHACNTPRGRCWPMRTMRA